MIQLVMGLLILGLSVWLAPDFKKDRSLVNLCIFILGFIIGGCLLWEAATVLF